jgi:CheY-like chemotaxis protein
MPNILIVDDETELATYLAESLEDYGWRAGTAANGVEAVLRVLDGGWDAVILDVRMPKLDGVSALTIIRRVSPSLPAVIFTGQAGQGEMLEATRLGAFACLLKPCPTEKLIQTLEAALQVSVQ